MNSLILQLTGVNLGYTIIALQFFYCIIFWYCLCMGFLSWTEKGNYHVKKAVEATILSVVVTALVVAISWYPSLEITQECMIAMNCSLAMAIAPLQHIGSLLVISVALVYFFQSHINPFLAKT